MPGLGNYGPVELSPPLLIALDVDGTLFDGVSVADEPVAALRAVHAEGHLIVIVTGRRWDSVIEVVPQIVVLAARVVCEEGGVIVDPQRHQTQLLAPAAEPELIATLERAGVTPLDIGQVVIGAPATFLAELEAARDLHRSTRRIVHNKASIALTPPECDKGSGLRAAVDALGAHDRPILAIGDAENDLPMFAAATYAVAVANADDAVRASGVPLTAASVGLGVVEALRLHVPTLRSAVPDSA
jgi:hydroxymethylpyrimidine pyrophosphatase-like HAD family hydrolase